MHVANILDTYRRATLSDIDEGMQWYSRAHELALELSPNDVWRGAGVIAALSPNQSWKANVSTARRSFETGIVKGSFHKMNAQGQRILDGEFALDVLNGPKVRAFASAIANPHNSPIPVIDRHAWSVANNQNWKPTNKITTKVYNELALAFTTAADIVGINFNDLQAITWVTWREEKGITW